MIKYLGSKRTLIPALLDAVRGAVDTPTPTVFDLFSGTSRVGHALKAAGCRVIANDHNAYAHALAMCYVQADADDLEHDAARLIAELNTLPGTPGYFTRTFCERSRYLHPRNGERIDAIRDAIARKSLAPELEAVLLVSLMEAADRVDSTTGVQMAYLKAWAPRAHNALDLRVPALLPRAAAGKGQALRLDALEAARTIRADVAYVDPPYNQHSYLGNYHVWETLVRWDKPEVYGVACKRVDCRERRSAFNSRARCREALREVLAALDVRAVVVSLSNEGFVEPEQMREMLAALWGGSALVEARTFDYPRYVGARIGIYNPLGVKVGRVSHLRNTEHLFIATRAGRARKSPGSSEPGLVVSASKCPPSVASPISGPRSS
ncbi:MAG: DNA adenine methylase [Phycisphaerales bacterium]